MKYIYEITTYDNENGLLYHKTKYQAVDYAIDMNNKGFCCDVKVLSVNCGRYTFERTYRPAFIKGWK